VDASAWIASMNSLVTMELLGCRTAFAFDRHFVQASRQRGLVVLP
jgi:predicted nucleic acid-binding protein